MEKPASSPRTYRNAFVVGIVAFIVVILMAFALRHHSTLAGDLALVVVVATAATIGWKSRAERGWLSGAAFGIGFCLPLWIILPIASRLSSGQQNPWAWLISGLAVVVAVVVAQTGSFVRHRRMIGAVTICLSTALVMMGVWKGFPKFLQMKQARQTASLTNQPLPTLQLTDLEGTSIPESALSGNVTVINFWGTWCVVCVAEMPDLEAISKDYSAEKGVKFLIVNSEVNGDDTGKIHRFIARKKMTLPVALDPAKSFHKFGVDALPLTLIVDRKAHIRFINGSFSDATVMRKQLHSQIDSLLVSN